MNIRYDTVTGWDSTSKYAYEHMEAYKKDMTLYMEYSRSKRGKKRTYIYYFGLGQNIKFSLKGPFP